ncbi:hypothetical protein HMPREF1556_00437 [Porphyromonas sp. oral taxon 278 str. W7784]|nr:hypothetical protein HMPREF1556_00437 [Porphyromonas sp. oral taxon 278 str. W7784]
MILLLSISLICPEKYPTLALPVRIKKSYLFLELYEELKRTTHGRSSKKPTIGRLTDPR